jgi:hypothetical protein
VRRRPAAAFAELQQIALDLGELRRPSKGRNDVAEHDALTEAIYRAADAAAVLMMIMERQ